MTPKEQSELAESLWGQFIKDFDGLNHQGMQAAFMLGTQYAILAMLNKHPLIQVGD